MPTAQHPTLAGAERGSARPIREIPGGIWIYSTADAERPENVQCSLRVVRESVTSSCVDYARQYLQSRGDKSFTAGQLTRLVIFLQMHEALIDTPIGDEKLKALYPLPATIANDKGQINAKTIDMLSLGRLADGQLDKIQREYAILIETETPSVLTHKEWGALIEQGKSESLRTLILQHGSSALTQLVHGMGREYPE